MKNVILIPTYTEHFDFNINFLESVSEFCRDGRIPHIFFITSTVDESRELSAKIELMQSNIKDNVFVLDVEPDFNEYNEVIESHKNDMDSSIYFLGGRSGLVNLKKISGLERVFSQGYENIVVLDSEVLVFRSVNLLEAINSYVDADIYRYSIAAHNHEVMTKIQYDSIRSVVRQVDSVSYFSQSYGWYENLCVYNKDKFYGFLEHITENDNAGLSKNVLAAYHLKGAAFEWISYMAYRVFVLKDEPNTICVDESIVSNVDRIIMLPQNENLYQYITEDDLKNSDFLSAINPPWVPYTENKIIRKLLNECLPSTCCLMFHVDRKHPGSEGEINNTVMRVKNLSERIFLKVRSLFGIGRRLG